MSKPTTAQRLGQYRAELTAAGFSPGEVWNLLAQAAPYASDDIVNTGDVTPPVETPEPEPKDGRAALAELAQRQQLLNSRKA